MIERDHPKLSVGAQCRLLSISRSSFYYAPQGETAMNLGFDAADRQAVSGDAVLRRPADDVAPAERRSCRERKADPAADAPYAIDADLQKPNTSKPAKGHKTYPYLLGGLRIDRPNQVWCADITYLPMRKGFLYLVAIMDWFTRKVLAWRISNTLEAEFCIEALNEAIHKFGPPEIMNTDQGSQGGLNRSSQHSADGGCDDDRQTKIRTVDAAQIILTGAARSGATIGAAPFLVPDCLGSLQRGGCHPDRHFAAGRNTVVSRGWRHAPFPSGPIRAVAIAALPVPGRARRDRSAPGAKHWPA